ncbi:MAG TPA: IS1 family transposase [Acidimicrobiales bacterium]|nr:IS1 family transposase [Acidimicrobiales bacterium]
MNRLSTERRAQVVACLVEGMSIRATVRVTGVAKNTIVNLLADLGAACAEYQDAVLTNLPCRRIECDEIWSFCYAKQKNVPEEHRGTFGYGDVWTWTAIDADTKLVPSWLVGERTVHDAWVFLSDLKSRLRYRVQLTSDGHRPYLTVVEPLFGSDGIDFAMLHKLYGHDTEGERTYSPAVCTGTDKRIICGIPDERLISTSYVERQNLTMRMGMRRFTRLTNAFSKKVENLAHAVSLHYMHYNFCRVHQSLTETDDNGRRRKRTPAMAAGVADHAWSVYELVGLLESN